MPFYRRLAKTKPPDGIKLVAIFSQNIDAANEYLASNKLVVDTVVSSSLRSIDVTSTPTILIVDKNGIVKEFWRRKLGKEGEEAVLEKLQP